MNALKKALEQASKSAKGGAPKGSGSAVAALIGLGALGYGGAQAMVTVRPGHRGIIYNRFGFGAGAGIEESKVLREGLNFVVPWFQRAIIFDIQTRPQLINTHSGSKDLQMVQISLRVLFKPDSSRLPNIYRSLGYNYDERVLPSIVNEVTKAIVARYNASELLTKREEVSKMISVNLKQRAGDFDILLDDVAVTHLGFSKEYMAAVEAKQVALQDSQRAKYIVEKALQEKKTIIIKAQGEARSAALIGGAIANNPAFLQLRRIDAAKEVAAVIQGSQGKVYLDAENLMLNALGEKTDLDLKHKKKGWLW
jgi:prohibitin 2